MNSVTTEYLDRLANLTEEEFHNAEIRQQLQNELSRIQDILSTVKELLLAKSTTLLTVEDAACILEEDPLDLWEEAFSLTEQNVSYGRWSILTMRRRTWCGTADLMRQTLRRRLWRR